MRYTVTFEIECGEKTCASAPGKFCAFCRWEVDGKGYCRLFGKVLWDVEGWLHRTETCLERADPMKTGEFVWNLYRNGRWHAYEDYSPLSLCGCARRELEGPKQSALGIDQPSCSTCRRLFKEKVGGEPCEDNSQKP